MVKTKIGISLILLGAILISGAIGMIVYNNYIQKEAERSVESILPRLTEKINNNIEATERLSYDSYVANELPDPMEIIEEADPVMNTVEVEEHEYISMISIPSLSLELPVMADWNKTKLNISPCRYSGTVDGNDLVVMAQHANADSGQS